MRALSSFVEQDRTNVLSPFPFRGGEGEPPSTKGLREAGPGGCGLGYLEAHGTAFLLAPCLPHLDGPSFPVS